VSAVVAYLLTWPSARLAQELYRHAKENAALRDRVFELEHELFWMKAAERNEHRKENADA
jgi:hypothetical protein